MSNSTLAAEYLTREIGEFIDIIALTDDEWLEKYPQVKGWTPPTKRGKTPEALVFEMEVCWDVLVDGAEDVEFEDIEMWLDHIIQVVCAYVGADGDEEDRLLAMFDFIDSELATGNENG